MSNQQAILDRMRQAIRSGSAVIVLGTGFSAATSAGAECATWTGLLESGIERAKSLTTLTDAWLKNVRDNLAFGTDEGDTDALVRAASMISGKLQSRGSQAYADWLRDTVGQLDVVDPTLGRSIRELSAPILTTNYDSLIESSIGRDSSDWIDEAEFQRVLTKQSDSIFHIHGVWSKPNSVVLSSDDYGRLAASTAHQTLQQSILASHSVIYIGYGAGLSDPNFERLLAWNRATFKVSGAEHFRLALESEVTHLSSVHSADNITVVPYGAQHGDLPDFIRALRPPADAPKSDVGLVRDIALDAQRAMADVLISENLLAEALVDATTDAASVMLPPVLLPVPHPVFVKSQHAKAEKRLSRLDPEDESVKADLTIVVGDDESGLTTTVRWLAWRCASNLGVASPIYVNFRQCSRGHRPLHDQVRAAAASAGLPLELDGSLPAHVLALDDLNANVARVSDKVIREISNSDAIAVFIGCKQGQEDDIVRALETVGKSPRVRYVGRLSRKDIQRMATTLSPTSADKLTHEVMRTLRSESLPRTPLSVSLLLAILFRGGRLASASSQTTILDSYVSSLLGRGDPHEDARFGLGETGREAVLTELAEAFVRTESAGIPQEEAVAVVSKVQEKYGWNESSIGAISSLIERHVLRSDQKHVRFSRNSYLHLFAAKRAGQDAEFRAFLARRPLYHSSILKAHAALVRTDASLLKDVQGLLDSRSDLDRAAPLRQVETQEIPTGEDLVDDSEPDTFAPSRDIEYAMYDDVTDDSDRPAFPSDDPLQMSRAYRLIRTLDLVSSILRDSDQVADLDLKREVFVEALGGWGNLVAELADDETFMGFARSLARELADVLHPEGADSDDLRELFDQIESVLPSAMSLGGIQSTLASRKLLSSFSSAKADGSLERDGSIGLAAIFFSYSVADRGWPEEIRTLLVRHGLTKRWIIHDFLLLLLMDQYVSNTVEEADREALGELCAFIVVESFKEQSGPETKAQMSIQKDRLERRRLGRLTRSALSPSAQTEGGEIDG